MLLLLLLLLLMLMGEKPSLPRCLVASHPWNHPFSSCAGRRKIGCVVRGWEGGRSGREAAAVAAVAAAGDATAMLLLLRAGVGVKADAGGGAAAGVVTGAGAGAADAAAAGAAAGGGGVVADVSIPHHPSQRGWNIGMEGGRGGP